MIIKVIQESSSEKLLIRARSEGLARRLGIQAVEKERILVNINV
jgi:hypothetical protein